MDDPKDEIVVETPVEGEVTPEAPVGPSEAPVEPTPAEEG